MNIFLVLKHCSNNDIGYLLQGYLDYSDEPNEGNNWIGTPGQIWERIGNSVPPNLMKAIALHIKENILNQIN